MPLSRPRRILLASTIAAAAVVATTQIVPRMLDRRYYRGATSSHYNGHRFFNPDGERGTGGVKRYGPFEVVRRSLLGVNKLRWPRSIPVPRGHPPMRVAGSAMRVTWIGHATALVQTQGLNILTDPVWADRASPVGFAGPHRVRMPGVALDDLPPIDLVLISHNHYDHLDITTLGRLWQRDHPVIVVPLGNDAILRGYGIDAVARDWGERVTVRPGIDVIVEQAHHWSARWQYDRDRALWGGFTVTLPGGNLFYAGDTGPGDMRWPDTVARHGPFRLAILPIGAFQPRGRETGNHLSPDQAVQVFQRIGARYALGVHWGTFRLTGEYVDEPRQYLRRALRDRHVAPGRFRAPDPGIGWQLR